MGYHAEDCFDDIFKGKESLEAVLEAIASSPENRGFSKLLHTLMMAMFFTDDLAAACQELLSKNYQSAAVITEGNAGTIAINGQLPFGSELKFKGESY